MSTDEEYGMSRGDTTNSTAGSRPRAVGRREERGAGATLVIERTFRAPVEDVWAAVTESQRLGRWIGTWTGDRSVTRRCPWQERALRGLGANGGGQRRRSPNRRCRHRGRAYHCIARKASVGGPDR